MSHSQQCNTPSDPAGGGTMRASPCFLTSYGSAIDSLLPFSTGHPGSPTYFSTSHDLQRTVTVKPTGPFSCPKSSRTPLAPDGLVITEVFPLCLPLTSRAWPCSGRGQKPTWLVGMCRAKSHVVIDKKRCLYMYVYTASRTSSIKYSKDMDEPESSFLLLLYLFFLAYSCTLSHT